MLILPEKPTIWNVIWSPVSYSESCFAHEYGTVQNSSKLRFNNAKHLYKLTQERVCGPFSCEQTRYPSFELLSHHTRACSTTMKLLFHHWNWLCGSSHDIYQTDPRFEPKLMHAEHVRIPFFHFRQNLRGCLPSLAVKHKRS